MVSTFYASPFLNHVDLSWDISSFTNGSIYKLKNTNSGLYT